ISGDLWAGAEAQAFALLSALSMQPEMSVAVALMNEGELARRLRSSNIPVTVIPESRLSFPRLLHKLRRLISDWRPDVIHTHRTKENILGSLANLTTGRAACIRTVHGADEHK